MNLNKSIITKGMYLSGVMNIGGVLIFSRFFTNDAINNADPVVMSNFGLLMIVVWGLAFLAMAANWEQLRWVIGAFAIEKIIYAITWSKWMVNNDLSAIYAKDVMAGIFYTIYGINDWIFFVFYSVVFIYLIRSQSK